MEVCEKCGQLTSTLYATKETPDGVSEWRCEACWWATVRLQDKKKLGTKRLNDE